MANEFDFFELTKIPWGDNATANTLASLTSTSYETLKRITPLEKVDKPSITLASKVCLVTICEDWNPTNTECGYIEVYLNNTNWWIRYHLFFFTSVTILISLYTELKGKYVNEGEFLLVPPRLCSSNQLGRATDRYHS